MKSPQNGTVSRVLPAPQSGSESHSVEFSPALSTDSGDKRYVISENSRPVGSFHLIFQNDTVYFYDFEIHEKLRNQGIGGRAAAALIGELNRMAKTEPEYFPFSRVMLQVSGDNGPALQLYRKLGFEFTETLAYYLY